MSWLSLLKFYFQGARANRLDPQRVPILHRLTLDHSDSNFRDGFHENVRQPEWEMSRAHQISNNWKCRRPVDLQDRIGNF